MFNIMMAIGIFIAVSVDMAICRSTARTNTREYSERDDLANDRKRTVMKNGFHIPVMGNDIPDNKYFKKKEVTVLSGKSRAINDKAGELIEKIKPSESVYPSNILVYELKKTCKMYSQRTSEAAAIL
jgi:hypothetical protein